jgi:hypothetical protein
MLLKWIFIESKDDTDECLNKKEVIDTSVRNLTGILVSSVTTKRQVNYKEKTGEFCTSLEIPFSDGLGLFIHQEIRYKTAAML